MPIFEYPIQSAPAGGAGVTTPGTAVAGQVAFFTAPTVIGGDPGLTYSAPTDTLTVAGRLNIGTAVAPAFTGSFAAGLVAGPRLVYTADTPSASAFQTFDSSNIPILQVTESSRRILLSDANGIDQAIVLSAQDGVITNFNAAARNIDFRIGSTNATAIFYVDVNADAGTGRVGVNTLTPDTLFHVNGDAHISGKLTVDGAIDPTQILLSGADKKFGATDVGTIYLAPFADSTTAVQIRQAGGTVIMNIDASNQRVGIGTTTPQVRLEVAGAFRMTTDGGFELTNQTDYTSANVGTLNNAPSGGDPAVWAPVMFNGQLYAMPLWTIP